MFTFHARVDFIEKFSLFIKVVFPFQLQFEISSDEITEIFKAFVVELEMLCHRAFYYKPYIITDARNLWAFLNLFENQKNT